MRRHGGVPSPPPRPADRVTAAKNTDINTLPYYHPNLRSMDEIKQKLSAYSSQEGYFLLRNSLSKPGYYTITVTHSTGIKHFNVERTAASFYLKDIHFETMHQLVEYYGQHEVPNKEQLHNVMLRHPIGRSAEMSKFRQLMCGAPRQRAGAASVGAASGQYLSVVDDDITSPDVYIHPGTSAPNLKRHQTLPSRPTTSPVNDVPRRSLASQSNVNTFFQADEAGYSVVGDDSECKMGAIIAEIQRLDPLQDDVVRCDCGLPEDKAALPRGWSVHLSRDPDTLGEVYFMSPSRETSWTLPLSVSLELSPDQQDFIRDCIFEFETRTKCTARARLASQTPAAAATSSISSVAATGPIQRLPPATNQQLVTVSAGDSYIGPTSSSSRHNNNNNNNNAIEESNYTDMNGRKTLCQSTQF